MKCWPSRVCNVEIDVVIDDCSVVESTALLAVSVRKLNTDILSFLLIYFVGGFAFFDPFASCDKCASWNTRALLVQLIACRGKRLQSLRKLVQPICLKQFDLAKKAGFISKSQELSGSCPVHCSALVRLEKSHQPRQQRRQQGEGTGPLGLAFNQSGTCNRTKSGCRHTQPVIAPNPCIFGVEMPLA
ncbi:hypothetical protein HMPREF9080_01567 [Cardiobacterium valvarum F0432]|uniref:Uncharacterized protein n=1 Tax=Cardiobacterium valvarum F0432 TaxID=797473 RepID=G9ZFL9_9GAMM|nr:hypothetical protein HMPREF9080_01567 [Cardiobacterium valvarum F0432]